MFGLSDEEKQLPKVANFYHGKSVFITGATGFVGMVLLETILRCCPEIKSIYVLIRAKKNIEPGVRKEEIFKKKIFKRLKEENWKMLEKVCVITGDISYPNLGIHEQELQILIEEVSVVFHCASNTNFHKPLKFMLLNNVLSLNSIIELSRRMKKFEALVYTSSAYCNYNYRNVTLKEEVYRLTFRAEKFLDALINKDDEMLQELLNQCKPDWPNTYTFSKCLAENLIMDKASDLPIAIIRPSIIMSAWKSPIPGYAEDNFAASAIFLGIGKGFLKVLPGDPDWIFNFVPVDVVANTHVIAACTIGANRCGSPMIVHCTCTEKAKISLSELCKTVTQVACKFPLPKSFRKPTNCIIVKYWFLFYIVAAYYHYLPAIVLDGVLKILGKRPRVYSFYRLLDKAAFSVVDIIFNNNEFERNNLEYLDKLIHHKDRKDLSLDFSAVTFLDLSLLMPEAAPFYDWKTDDKSQSERQKINYWCRMIIKCIEGSVILIFSVLIYWMSFLIFE